MEFVTGFSTPSRIEAISRAAVREAESVEAAVAYVTDVDQLIKDCFDLNVRFTLWGRYDYTQPVSVPVLQRFLDENSPNFVFRFVPDIFHPKVIWWHGYGIYVGSANMTKAAWLGNVEAGMFFTEDEIDEHDLRKRFEDFLEDVNELSRPLTKELLDEARRFVLEDPLHKKEMEEGRKRFDQARLLPRQRSLISITKRPKKRNEDFLKEWNSTIQTLRLIANRVVDYRPEWVESTVPSGAQADQFLHAYYYQQVRDGASHPFREFYKQNRENPEAAMKSAMKWWCSLPNAPGSEAEMLHTWLPLLQLKLSENNLLTLTRGDFAEVCAHVHAMRDHGNRMKWRAYGLDEPLPKMSVDDRARFFGNWLYDQKSPNGRSVLESIYYVLHEGVVTETPQRIFETCFNPEFKVNHLGLGSLGELVGWVHPDYSPPRNGRTSKALVALGFAVHVYGENEN